MKTTRRIPARVPVHLRQYHPGQGELRVELLGALHRVLARHGVADEQHLVRLDPIRNLLDLGHQALVDMQSPRRVQDHIVSIRLLGVPHGPLADPGGPSARLRVDRHAELLSENFQLRVEALDQETAR